MPKLTLGQFNTWFGAHIRLTTTLEIRLLNCNINYLLLFYSMATGKREIDDGGVAVEGGTGTKKVIESTAEAFSSTRPE